MSRKITIEIANKRINALNLSLIGNYINTHTKINLRCYCGKEFSAKPTHIFDGRIRSCGCYHKSRVSEAKLTNLTGREINRCEVLELLPKRRKEREYLCRCHCGKIFSVMGCNLITNNTRSCGCLAIESRTGPNNWKYNPNLTKDDRFDKRKTPENKKWIENVLFRDNFVCQICKCTGYMVAHHLDGYHWCKERRVDITNGITLCIHCHKDFHHKYGNRNNTEAQFIEYKGILKNGK